MTDTTILPVIATERPVPATDTGAARRRRVATLARHEIRAATRSRILVVLLGILVTVTTVSVLIAAADYRSQVADYQDYVASATAGGVTKIAPSPLRPLSLLRSSIEYLEIIGAVIAITLGYLSVARERANRTLALLRSRPVTAGEQALGSLLGAMAILAALVVVTMAVGVITTGVVGNDWINGDQAVKLLLATLAGVLFSVTPGASRVIHFDDSGAPDHFPDNPYSLYHTSLNGLDVTVEVSAQGTIPQTATVQKDPGGDEVAD